MSISTPSKGTHFSDGVRTGPEILSQYTAGANVLAPATQVSTPVDQQPPGVFNTPYSLTDIIPAPVATASLAALQTLAGAGNLSLVSVNSQNTTVLTYQSNSGVCQLDVPRNVTITGAGGSNAVVFTVTGWDQYGMPMHEAISFAGGAVTTSGNKAFMYILSIAAAGATAANVSAGVGNTFGLQHLVTNANYIGIPEWNSRPDTGIIAGTTSGALANNPITTQAAGSGVVYVTVTSTAALYNGEFVTIAGATTTDSITAVQLNITAPITVIDATHFAYVTMGNAGTGGTAGGGAAVTYTPNSIGFGGTFVVGDEHVATATTGDVRGTYAPTSNADGIKRLTINYYSASGDARRSLLSQTGAVILNTNPLTNTNGQNTIVVTAPNHQFTTGENVTISGGVGNVGGISPANYNITAPVTIIDANTFSYVNASGVDGTGGTSGGTVVLMTPQFGDLYTTPIGRFGVSQF